MEQNIELKEIVAKNLVKLRKIHKLTQSEIADKLNYSDKAVSKWERGESLPDLQVLVNLCDIYHVTLNDLITRISEKKQKKILHEQKNKTNIIIITSLMALSVWLIAAVVYAYSNYPTFTNKNWVIFIWAIPVSFLLIFTMNLLVGNKDYNAFLLSIVSWGAISAFYCNLLPVVIWPLFIVGIPIQVALIIYSRLEH